jgi:hypothetical protein
LLIFAGAWIVVRMLPFAVVVASWIVFRMLLFAVVVATPWRVGNLRLFFALISTSYNLSLLVAVLLSSLMARSCSATGLQRRSSWDLPKIEPSP